MYLDIIQEDEFPSIQVRTNSDIHILHSCPLKPTSWTFQSLDPPYSSSSIETKEVQEDPINLLLHFEMEAQVDILKARQEILILVHKAPSCLN